MSQNNQPLALALRDVHASYGKKEILRGVNIAVRRGEILGLFGGNGSGKSTTLKVITGLLIPTQGDIRLGAEAIIGRLPHEVRCMGVGYLPQGGRIFPNLSVVENLEVAGWASGTPLVFRQLERLLKRRAGLLSGGERQQLALEMVLTGQPNVLLLDEPSAGLASPVIRFILDSVRNWAIELGRTVVLVEQNVEEAKRVADRTVLLVDGHLADDAGSGA